MPKHISLSDVVFNSVFVSPRCEFHFTFGFRSFVVCATRFGPAVRPSLARPSPARPSSARVPLAPPAPMRVPPGPFSLISILPRSNLSLSHLSISPRGALGFGDGDRRSWIPEVSSPPLSSLPLPLPPLPFPARAPFFSPARAPPCNPSRAAPMAHPSARPPAPLTVWLPRPPVQRPLLPPPSRAAPSPTPPPTPRRGVPGSRWRGPSPLRVVPAPCARPSAPGGAAPAPTPGGAAPWPLGAALAPSRAAPRSRCARPCTASRFPVYPMRSRVRSPTRAVIDSWFLINFKPCLVSVLRRATNLFNFRFY
jgi:hypothetical protein